MRIALVDLLFCWPPHGGADVDTYQVARQLHEQGQQVHLFVSSLEGAWDRGSFDPEDLPFPATRIDFTPKGFTAQNVPRRIHKTVSAWQPELVMVTDGFFLKPLVLQALSDYPTIGRYYAYEMACHRDILHFKEGRVCPYAFLDTPDLCRTCAAEGLETLLKSGQGNAWTQEYIAARAYAPEYYYQNKKLNYFQ